MASLLALLGPRGLRQLAGVVAAAVAGGGLQVLALAAVTDFMARLSGSPPLLWGDPGWPLGLAGLATVATVAAANAVGLASTLASRRFVWGWEHELSARLLAGYLRMPYRWLAGRHSAALAKDVLSHSVAHGVLMPLAEGLTQAVTAAMLLGALVVADPALALGAMGALGLAYGLLAGVSRRHLDRFGEEAHRAEQARFRTAMEALAGFKAVRAARREEAFAARYREQSEAAARRHVWNGLALDVPRVFLETVALGGMVALAVLVARRGEALLPMLALYGMAGYRLLPALHRVGACAAEARLHLPALQGYREGLAAWGPAGPREEPLRLETGIRVAGAGFDYGGRSGPALREVHLWLPRGGVVGLVGPTGAGKTTLVDLLLGLLEPTEGQVLVDDEPLTPERARRWLLNVGYVPQEAFLVDDTVVANIAFGLPPGAVDREAVERAARAARIHDFVASLPQGYDTVVGDRGVGLSGGQRQRLAIARALYHDPQVLVLDEATSALDGATEAAVLEAVLGLEGRTVLLVSHRSSAVQGCHEVYRVEGGRVAPLLPRPVAV